MTGEAFEQRLQPLAPHGVRLAVQEQDLVPVLVVDPERGLQRRLELPPRILDPTRRLPHPCLERSQDAPVEQREDVLFPLDVAVQCPGAEPRGLGDLAHAGLVKPLLREELQRRITDLRVASVHQRPILDDGLDTLVGHPPPPIRWPIV